MTAENRLQKRIKRHLIGRSQEFFIVTSPGLERLCLAELQALPLTENDASVTHGGVQFVGRVHDCYLANLCLRTASRILMRIDTFSATNFRQLGKKIRELPWELYLPSGVFPAIQVRTMKSRLYHKEAIAQVVQESIIERLAANGLQGAARPDETVEQTLYVRAEADAFTVSIDSSGPLLHKRGLKTHGGRAPLRENLAVAILALAGYDGTGLLLDPMCGTGTFALEAAMVVRQIPAGWYREFAFMGWPCFRESRWRHVRRELQEGMKHSLNGRIFSSDSNETACRNLAQTVSKNGLDEVVSVAVRDFFDLAPSSLGEDIPVESFLEKDECFLVLNPPYGRRIGSVRRSEALFAEIGDKLRSDFCNWRVALIVPHPRLIKKIPFKTRRYPLLHGGLKLQVAVGRVPSF